MDNPNRVVVFVDGFNLYHAIDELDKHPTTKRATNTKHYLKWINLWALATALVHPKNDKLVAAYYFSAFAGWINKDAQDRHRDYVAALKSTGVQPVMGTFKNKPRKCPKCKHSWWGHEEKESDVNLAIYLVKLAFEDAFDKAIVFTADTDLAPAIRVIKSLYPEKDIRVAIPERRLKKSNALVAAADGKYRLTEAQFERNLFAAKISLPSGITLIRPSKYALPAAAALAPAVSP